MRLRFTKLACMVLLPLDFVASSPRIFPSVCPAALAETALVFLAISTTGQGSSLPPPLVSLLLTPSTSNAFFPFALRNVR
jgi:hypothetical protein